MAGNHKSSARNRNKEYVHQTDESYIEWFDATYYPDIKPKVGRPPMYSKVSLPKDYVLKIVHKEIILYFD